MARGVLALPPELRPRDPLEEIAGVGAGGDGEVAEGAASVGATDDGLPRGGSSPAEDERDAADAPAEPETEPWRRLELALHLHLPHTAPATRPWSLSPARSPPRSAPAPAVAPSSSPSPPWSSPSTPTSLPPPPRSPAPPTAEYLDTAADYGAAAWDAAELMPHLRELTVVLPARRADSPRGFAELLARSMSMDVRKRGLPNGQVRRAVRRRRRRQVRLAGRADGLRRAARRRGGQRRARGARALRRARGRRRGRGGARRLAR